MALDLTHKKEILTCILGAIVTYASRIEDFSDPEEWVIGNVGNLFKEQALDISASDLENFKSDPLSAIWLSPVFSKIKLDENKSNIGSEEYRYKAGEFTLEKLFPEAKSAKDDASVLYSRDLLDKLIKALGTIKDRDFFSLLGELDSLLFRFLWNVPASKDEPDDTSLYESTRLKVAEEAAKGSDEEKPYLLIKGDLSGIQPYIREAAGYRSKGAAKRLRARSFKLQALVMAFCDRFVRSLDLTPMNILSENGGNFVILATNDGRTGKAIDAAKRAVQKFFYDETWMDTSLSLASVPLKESDFQIEAYQVIQNRLNASLQTEKQRKFKTQLMEAGKFMIGNDLYYYNTDSQPFCRNCQKFPKLSPKSDNEKDLCEKCSLDVELGGWLVNADEIVIGPYNGNSQLQFDFKDPDGSSWDFSSSIWLKDIPAEITETTRFWLVKDLNSMSEGGFRFLSNWVPCFSDKSEVDAYQEQLKQRKNQIEEDDDSPHIHDIKSFGHIACYRPKGGAAYLGVLKADVDNLGQVMQKGLGKSGSVARLLGLSRLLDAFFSGWTRAFLSSTSEGIEYVPSDIYTVYSGGDDLLFVGRWDDLILFTVEFRKRFNDLCCGNITISSAVVVVSPNYPISEAVLVSEEMLGNAKDMPGKNSFAVFSTVLPGQMVEEILGFARQIENTKDEKGDPVMGSSMIQRFLEYQDSAIQCLSSDGKPAKDIDPRRLIYRSHVKYEIARNFYGKKKPEELPPDVKTLTDRIIGAFFREDDENKKMLKYLRFPLTWAAYRQRSGTKEKESDNG